MKYHDVFPSWDILQPQKAIKNKNIKSQNQPQDSPPEKNNIKDFSAQAVTHRHFRSNTMYQLPPLCHNRDSNAHSADLEAEGVGCF